MKKNNVALWGTGFVGAFICILADSNYAATMNSDIGWLGIGGGVVALICAYLFFNDAFKVLMNEASEKNVEELAEAAIKVQKEKKRQERLEKKLDELILVEKAVYTMLKKQTEANETAYEKMESQLWKMTDKLLNNQQNAAKAVIKYNRDDIKGATRAISEELIKVQNTVNDLQNHILDATGEIKTEIQSQTEDMARNLSNLEDSIQNINISVAAPVVESMAAPAEAAVSSEDILLEHSFMKDSFTKDSLEEMEVPELENVDHILAEVESELEEIDFPEDIMTMIEAEEEPELVIEDSNRAMTPDEIAALIASVGGGEKKAKEKELVVEVPKPESVEPEPVMEDPNRAMTPDEIAALIASMN